MSHNQAGTDQLDTKTAATIGEAARWYRDNRNECLRPVHRAISRRYGLSTRDAIAAIRQVEALGASNSNAEIGDDLVVQKVTPVRPLDYDLWDIAQMLPNPDEIGAGLN